MGLTHRIARHTPIAPSQKLTSCFSSPLLSMSNMRGNELYKICKVNKHDCNSLVLFVWRSIHIYCINKKHNLIFILILPCSSPQQWLRKNKKLMNSRSKAGLLERSDIIISSFFCVEGIVLFETINPGFTFFITPSFPFSSVFSQISIRESNWIQFNSFSKLNYKPLCLYRVQLYSSLSFSAMFDLLWVLEISSISEKQGVVFVHLPFENVSFMDNDIMVNRE